jgi:hypothetical protein
VTGCPSGCKLFMRYNCRAWWGNETPCTYDYANFSKTWHCKSLCEGKFLRTKLCTGPKDTIPFQRNFYPNLAFFQYLHVVFIVSAGNYSTWSLWFLNLSLFASRDSCRCSDILDRSHTRSYLTWRENCISVIWNIAVGFEQSIGHVCESV